VPNFSLSPGSTGAAGRHNRKPKINVCTAGAITTPNSPADKVSNAT
jgi:hypothetical protein